MMILFSPDRHQFGVHHERARNAAVAIGERMHLRHQKHHEHGPMQRACDRPIDLEAFGKRALYQLGGHKQSGARTIGFGLSGGQDPHPAWPAFANIPAMAARHKRSMRFRELPGQPGHFACVRDDLPGTQNVVGVRRTGLWDVTVENKILRFIDGEFRSLDEIGEVGLEERQRGPIAGTREASHRRGSL